MASGVGSLQLDLGAMQKRKSGIVKGMTGGIAALLKSAGVVALTGHGRLLAGNKVEYTAADGSKTVFEAGTCDPRLRLRSHRAQEHAAGRSEHR